MRTEHWLARLRHDDRGTAVLEFASVMLILMTAFAGVIDFGRYLWYRAALQEVTADATRCSALYTSNLAFYTNPPYSLAASAVTSPCSNLSSYVSTLAQAHGVTITTTVSPTTSTACSTALNTSTYNTFYQATLTLNYQSLFGWATGNLGTFSTSVCFPY